VGRVRPVAPSRWVVAGLLLAITATAAAAQDAAELAEDLDATNQQLDQARTGAGVVQQQVTDAQAELARADSHLIALTDELRRREAELAEATAVRDAAAARTSEAQARLDEVTSRLDASKSRLRRDQDRFGDRVAAAYMYGGQLQMAEALLASEDIAELVQTGYYVRSVLDDDKELVDRVARETLAINEQRTLADGLRDRLATEQAAAERARADVDRATEAQRELTAQVAEQRAVRQATLERLQSDLHTYTQLVAAYEAESARLTEELARAEWQAAAPGRGGLLWPTSGRAGSGYGYRTHPIFGSRRLHTGVDVAGPIGQPIVAAARGMVVSAGWRGGYGLAVVIDHGGGLATLYAHQSRLHVRAGEVVDAGQQIGEIGSTGQSTGPHLHFEVREHGVPRDPMAWY
jgi:murein DD-endopeptidase MepM/ murein hydrolase activator NlpD